MKRNIYFITGNKSKFKEAKLLLDNTNANLVQKDLKLKEIKTLDQNKVVLEKARQAFKKLKKPVLVDDTAIYFEEHEAFPGTYTKYLFRSIGFKGVEKLLRGSNRNSYFQTLICYKDHKITKVFSGVWKGKIINQISKKFNPDWQYNSIFVPVDFKKPLSEIPLEERAKKSHRKKAFDTLIKYLAGQNERS
jgi:XTP/dITP diphosphohydrolase